ncbi:TRAP transporter small permease [Caminibacter mediatlanticus TB-2]|uniref:TRAP transporter small permease n=1 Tax=Caminibacter mediatlanticus TB-2 TaxID=391592 RepID=A0ABX5V705_9BACT|nr:TRAP transporter small permease [Caminibacter mediatlanticus]QCT94006.1 TRAP transporter small permease [Caminibacter mediatlanticus TB-2]
MKKIINFLNKTVNIGAFLASISFILLTLLILSEIFSRAIFNHSTMIADEFSGYLYLAYVFLALGYTFKENGHIRITIIYQKVSKKTKKFLDLFAGFLSLIVISFIFYRAILLCYESYSYNMLSEGVSETPIYLTQIPMVVGLFLFLLAIISFILKVINDK